MSSLLEIEQKFVVKSAERLSEALKSAGAELISTIWQKDDYFNHPCRDFRETDEAFRIRYEGSVRAEELAGKEEVPADSKWHVTYKGPKEPGTVKIREEIEFPLCDQPSNYQSWKTVLEKLSFRYVASVEKKRDNWKWTGSVGHPVLVTIDRVTDLGTFAEIEIVTQRDQIEDAEKLVWTVAKELGLDQPTRKSYLRQLLKKQDSRK